VALAAGRPAAQADWLLGTSLHISVADLGSGLGAAADLGVSAAWIPIGELALGLDAALMVPLRTGAGEGQTDLTLRACPVVWLRFGDDAAWGFVKAGLGVTAHLIDGSLEPVFVGVAGGGFIVAPRNLPFHFGFELTGELGLAGAVTTRALGLGGLIGWTF
jgi:hypothetical protein